MYEFEIYSIVVEKNFTRKKEEENYNIFDCFALVYTLGEKNFYRDSYLYKK